MKLFVFYPYIPYPLDRGTYQRTFHLLKGLAEEHEVDFFALAEEGEHPDARGVFEAFCRKVTFIPFEHPPWARLFPDRLFHLWPTTIAHWTSPAVEKALEEALTGTDYDAVHVCDIVMAQYFLKPKPWNQFPLVVDRSRVDLQFQWMERQSLKLGLKETLLRYENLLKLWFFERKVAKRATLEVVCGPDDLEFSHRVISKKAPVEVVANGVDLEYFQWTPEQESERAEKPTALFCGAMDYSPNVDAMRWYFENIHADLKRQVPEMELLLVGKNPIQEVKDYGKIEGVTVTGGVPDVRPYYRKAWLQIVPLRIGGGTRLKIAESMGIGTPVVSTTIGAQGLYLTHKKDIILADTPKDFARETAEALRDSALRNSIRDEGVRVAKERLSWGALSEKLSKIYRQRLGSGKGI
jgi:polysaccharide biosynthesis protein PslH